MSAPADDWMTGAEAREAIDGDMADVWQAYASGRLEVTRDSDAEPWRFRFAR